MATLDYTVVHGATVYPAGAEVPDSLAGAIENPTGGDVSDEGRPAKGQAKDVWSSYAEAQGVEVPEGATKAEIIAAVDGK